MIRLAAIILGLSLWMLGGCASVNTRVGAGYNTGGRPTAGVDVSADVP